MPLEISRLRRSKAWLICKRRPELAFYMLNLWTASWHERPAGSLEDDDDVLADAAMCSPERWQEIKGEVLRGWAKCSDGRLYHSVVVEKVADAWHSRTMKRWQNECDRLRKENGRRERDGQEKLPLPQRPERTAIGIPLEVRQTSDGFPAENALKGREAIGKQTIRDIPPEDGTTRAAYDAFVVAARRHEWPVPNKLTDPRRKALRGRLADAGGLDGFLAVIAKAEASDFLCNKMDGWSLDWLLKPGNFEKVRDGNYNRDRGATSRAPPPMQI
jgi:hypothetical protein